MPGQSEKKEYKKYQERAIMKRILERQRECLLGYIMYVPEERKEDMPLLIYLHGAGERGIHLEHVERHGIPYLISAEKKEIPALVLCPQCPAEFVWNNIVRETKSLIDNTVKEWNIKKDRICITGSSMGGYGTWEMGMTYPEYFSAIAPVCGGGMQWRSQKLLTTPVKAYHGNRDDVVEIVNSRMMMKNLAESNAETELVEMDGFGHNDGIYEAYKNRDLIEWLLSKRRTNFEPVREAFSEAF